MIDLCINYCLEIGTKRNEIPRMSSSLSIDKEQADKLHLIIDGI